MSWSRLYLFTALPFALALIVLMPLGEPPDEAAHISRAASLLGFELIGHRGIAPHPVDGTPIQVTVVAINRGLHAALMLLPSEPLLARKPVSWAALRARYAASWSAGREPVDVSNTGNYFPAAYLPAAAGMAVGEALGGNPAAAVFCARLANALVSIGLGALALRLAGRLGPLLFVLLSLPMTLHLDAAVNQDGPVISLAVLGAALLAQAGRRRYWGGVLALCCVCAAKPVYLPVVAVAVLLPLGGAGWRSGRHGAGFLLVCGVTLAWAGLAASVSVVPFWKMPYSPGPLWPGDPAVRFDIADTRAQLRVLAAQPTLLASLVWDTIASKAAMIASSAVGVLASLDLALPPVFYRCWYAAGALAVVATAIRPRGEPGPGAGAGAGAAVLVLLGGAVALWAVFLVQYLTWTEVGAAEIEGVQGRYLIPLAAVLALAVPAVALRPGLARGLRAGLAAPAVAMAWVNLLVVPSAVLLRYYVA